MVAAGQPLKRVRSLPAGLQARTAVMELVTTAKFTTGLDIASFSAAGAKTYFAKLKEALYPHKKA
eukprot:6383136-Lingulodinium_polyedra.AAC.1